MAIAQEVIDDIKERVNFVEIASEFVELKRSGRSFTGRCPFHNEKTPSFFVREEEGSFHCFGCGKKGSIFTFLMELKGMTFPEVVRYLGSRVGVDVPESGARSGESEKRSERLKFLRELMREVLEVYSAGLQSSTMASAYLRERGIIEQTVKDFRLGFAPKAWNYIEKQVLSRFADRHDAGTKIVSQSLLELGLVRQRRAAESLSEKSHTEKAHTDKAHTEKEGVEVDSTASGTFDVLRERLIFPIINTDGSVIAFGGRIIRSDPQAPKYLNTSESPLYLKRRTFYGLDRAIAEIRKQREAIIVEGYLDVLTMAQSGFTSTIATCGTAITPQHAQNLRRVADRVVMAFDGDAAGRKAAAQCFEVFMNSGLDVSVVTFPDNLDPDSALRERGAEYVAKIIAEAVPVVEIYLEQALQQEGGGGDLTPATIGRVAERFAKAAGMIENPVEREFMLKRGAIKLGTTVDSLDTLVRKQELARQGQGGRAVTTQRTERNHSTGHTSSESARTPTAPPPVPPRDLEADYHPSSSDRTDAPPAERGFSSEGRRGEQQNRHSANLGAKKASPGRRKIRDSADERRLGLMRQVLVASLAEPELASAFLAIEELFPTAAAGNLSENSEGLESTEPNSAINRDTREGSSERDKTAVIRFLEHLGGSGVTGLGSVVSGKSAEESSPEELLAAETLNQLLTRFGFGQLGLVEEALRQLKIGGWNPLSLMKECQTEAASWGLRGEVERLRVAEKDHNDEASRLQLAQEKLLKRRAMQRPKEREF